MNTMMKLTSALVLAACVSSIAAAAGGPAQFTAAQAGKGQSIYLARCAYCHGPNLHGVFAPALAGSGSNIPYNTPGFVYGYTSVYMPAGNAGSLSQTDYVNIIAFLMQQNGRPPGATALTVQTINGDSTAMAPGQ